MYQLLRNLTIVEGASFIAAPSCGLYFAQLGAEVIRFDMIGGGPDFGRWPKDEAGHSLYWEGLNKGKKSVAIALDRPEGRELAVALATAPGPGRGIFLTNFPATGFLAYDRLAKRRADMIVLRVMGRPDGEAAVDYTVNAAVGVPYMTGPANAEGPVNHVLPAWDLTTGAYAAFALLAAERHRQFGGGGEEVRIALSDVAMASLGNIGQVAEVSLSARDRPRFGNDLFGAFGRDFLTRDRARIMLVAITARQWSGLVEALNIAAEIAAAEAAAGVSFARDEGHRFEHRDRINAIVEKAVAGRDYADLIADFQKHGACWGPYRTVREALADDPDFSEQNPVFATIDHPSGHRYLTPGAMASFTGMPRQAPAAAPRLGEHTDEILATHLGLSAREIGTLHDRKIVAGPGEKP
ncbi:MAG: CoA transferase [Bauldia sp.]